MMQRWQLQRLYRFVEALPRRTAAACHALVLSPARIDRLAASSPTGERIARVLRRLKSTTGSATKKWIHRIEAERRELLRRNEPLVGGHTAEAGPFDAGKTIRSVCLASREQRPATLLHLLMREFQPAVAVELGTNLGVSSAYQAAAVEVSGGGELITLEASPRRLQLAKNLHQRIGLNNVNYVKGMFSDTLSEVLDEAEAVDYAFIDGHHQRQPTLDYFDKIWRHTAEEAVFVFDDIRWSKGMRRAWHALQVDSRIKLAVDLRSMGLCVTTRDPSPQNRHVTPTIAM